MKNNLETCMILHSPLSSPFGSGWVDLLSKLTLDLIDDLDLDKRGHFIWIYVCVLVVFIIAIQSGNINVTLKSGIMKLQ